MRVCLMNRQSSHANKCKTSEVPLVVAVLLAETVVFIQEHILKLLYALYRYRTSNAVNLFLDLLTIKRSNGYICGDCRVLAHCMSNLYFLSFYA